MFLRPAFRQSAGRLSNRAIAGAEHIGPEDTFDGDYGRLLEGAQQDFGKGVASPSIPSWNQIADWLKTLQHLREAAGTAA